MLVQERRNKRAALKLLRKLLKNQGVHLETITPVKLASYGAVVRELGLTGCHRPGGMRENNRGGERTLGNPTTGTKAAEVQIPGISPEVSLHPRPQLQHLQSTTPPDPPTDP